MSELVYPHYDVPGLTPPEVHARGSEFVKFHEELLRSWRTRVVMEASRLAILGDEHAITDAHMLLSD